MKWPRAFVLFDAALDDQTPGQTKIQRNEYASQGLLPIVDQGQKLVGGYCDDETRKYGGPLPVIVFGDHTRAFKFVDFPFALGADGVRVLTATSTFQAKFLFYYLLSAKIPSRGYARHFKFLREIKFPLIASSEQRRIVDLLEQVDTLRRQRAEAGGLAARILPALFRKFVGDPATNPNGWSVEPLGELATRVTKGESPGWQGFHYQDHGPIFVTSENVLWGAIELSQPKHIPIEFHQKLERSALRPRDVLINLVGASIGRSCLVPPDIGDANINQAVAVITCGPRILPEYLVSLLLTPAAQARFHGGKVEAARANISLNDVRSFPAILPPMGVQQRFVKLQHDTAETLRRCKVAQTNLAALFDVMLHRAFTGELTARWREAHMKELLAEMEQQARLLHYGH